LGDRLKRFWQYYGQGTRTATRDTSHYGLAYVSGLIRMDAKRNIANIGRQTGVSEQNMQHFITHSSWSARTLIEQMQQAVVQRGELTGGMLILDESGDEKSGEASAGVARQYNGRHKQVERSQVGVFLAYAHGNTWTWIDGELYLPREWFAPQAEARRHQAGLDPELRFQTKIQLGWQMIQRAQAAGIPFAAVACDSVMDTRPTFGISVVPLTSSITPTSNRRPRSTCAIPARRLCPMPGDASLNTRPACSSGPGGSKTCWIKG
jgi:SRSO17 transposase